MTLRSAAADGCAREHPDQNPWQGDPERGCVVATFRKLSARALGPSGFPAGEMAAARDVPVGSTVEAPHPDRSWPHTPGAA